MALQNIPPVTFQPELDQIYNTDQEIRDNIRSQYDLENLSLTRAQFQEAIDALESTGISLVSAYTAAELDNFVDIFNSYQAYMNA